MQSKLRMTQSRKAVEGDSRLRAPQWRTRPDYSSFIYRQLPVILLLVTLAGLATMAKDGQYYHGSNPEHLISLSTKMNVGQAPVVLGPSSSQRMGRILASKLRATTRVRIDYTPLPVQPVALRLSIRHRSPPVVVVL